MSSKKIVLITTGQPSTNPRIVKEADSLHQAGFSVVVLYSYFVQWAAGTDKELLQNVQWEYKEVGGSPFQNSGLYFFTRLRFKAAQKMNRFIGNIFLSAERSQARCYDELLRSAKAIKADWYIGHNLGSLSICVNAATFHKAKAGFDFEDYHRGENNNTAPHEKAKIEYLEKKYLPYLEYISAASAMTANKTGDLFPALKKKIITINNSFPLSQQPVFRIKPAVDDTLQLFWFSQTIGKQRGIETVIEAMKLLSDKRIHLTLAGRCDKSMQAYFDSIENPLRENIHLAGIIQPGRLPEFASRFDAGLALETGFSENNNMALSNKIFTYLLAGNAVIFSETPMQAAFNDQYKAGISFPVNDVERLVQRIRMYQDREKLGQQRFYNYNLAQTQLNWDVESEKLIKVITKNGNGS